MTQGSQETTMHSDSVSAPVSGVRGLLALFQQSLGHDLPNLLVALHGLTQLLAAEEGERLAPPARELLTRLEQGAKRAHELVQKLAEVGRAVRDPGPAETVDLKEAVREAFVRAKWLYPQRPFTYDIRELPCVSVPPRALQRALDEVVTLALRRGQPDHPIRFAVAVEGDALVISDDAPAWPEEHLRRFLDPLTVYAATGGDFGPYLASLLAESWGGALRLGPGSRARLIIPALAQG